MLHALCTASQSTACAGNVGNLLLVLVPAIARASPLFTPEDAARGLEYTFVGIVIIFPGIFSLTDALLTLPAAKPPETPRPCATELAVRSVPAAPLPPQMSVTELPLLPPKHDSPSSQRSPLASGAGGRA